jgi:D-amino-acid dehydrogenase
MHVIILGGGVIGVTSAYYLAKAGAEVTVVERERGAGLQTSFANAGQLSTGCTGPWAAPGIPLKALKWLFQRRDAPLAIRPDGSMAQLRWMAQLLRNCAPDKYGQNKSRMLRLSRHSQACLRELRDQTGIAYEQRTRGTLQLFRTAEPYRSAQRDLGLLRDAGVEVDALHADDCIAAEPALARVREHVAGGLRFPGDETGDCHMFTQALSSKAEALGVRFRYGSSVQELRIRNDRVEAVVLNDDVLEADHVVVAMGSYSTGLLGRAGIKLPVYPVKGYSITVGLKDDSAAPVSTVLDEAYKVAITRFDRRIRVGGMAELNGFDPALNQRRRATLELVLRQLFPDAASDAEPQFWTGLRPMTPDGTPIIGSAGPRNLWTNTGHGTLGWTMACGSGQLLADLVCGRTPAIRADDLGLNRYQRNGRRSGGIL